MARILNLQQLEAIGVSAAGMNEADDISTCSYVLCSSTQSSQGCCPLTVSASL